MLLHLHRLHQQAAEGGPMARRDLKHFGVPWRVRGSPAERASVSRTLKRLEERGLLLRQNIISGNPRTGAVRTSADEPHDRTTHVKLTAAGTEACERLTK